jgi:ABC-type uncharacterized transport system permease subunit
VSVLAILAATLRIAVPYLLAAAGGVMTERAGLIGLTLEGYMLGGAFCAVWATSPRDRRGSAPVRRSSAARCSRCCTR